MVMNQSSRGEYQRPTCLNDNTRETWCRCASALNPRSCLKESIAFQRAKPNPFQKNTITLLDLEGKEDSIPKPFTQ